MSIVRALKSLLNALAWIFIVLAFVVIAPLGWASYHLQYRICKGKWAGKGWL